MPAFWCTYRRWLTVLDTYIHHYWIKLLLSHLVAPTYCVFVDLARSRQQKHQVIVCRACVVALRPWQVPSSRAVSCTASGHAHTWRRYRWGGTVTTVHIGAVHAGGSTAWRHYYRSTFEVGAIQVGQFCQCCTVGGGTGGALMMLQYMSGWHCSGSSGLTVQVVQCSFSNLGCAILHSIPLNLTLSCSA